MEHLSAHTHRSYATALRQFAEYLHAHEMIDEPTPERAGSFLLEQNAPQANAIAQAWIQHLAAINDKHGRPKYTKRTILARMTALGWAVQEANRQGRITWTLRLTAPKARKNPKSGRIIKKAGRNMKGPSLDQIRSMFAVARQIEPSHELILALSFCETLRRHEIMQLDMEDVDVEREEIVVVRKMREDYESLPISSVTVKALHRYPRSTRSTAGAAFLRKPWSQLHG